MTGRNLKYKRTIHKCLARREKKEPQEPESNRYAENYKRWISFPEREGTAKVDAPPVKGKRQSPNDETKWEITTSFPTAVSQFVSHSISPRTQNSPNNKQLRVKKKKCTKHRKMKPPAAGGQPLTAGNHLNYMPAASLVGYHPLPVAYVNFLLA